ncbi:MAG TPA: FeoA domain-containing protein [Longimicrobiales bacterium]
MMQPFRSLASAHVGETLAIRRIRSKQVARWCEQLGMREGDAVQCRANTTTCLILRTSCGKVVSLDQDWARYIQVAEADQLIS